MILAKMPDNRVVAKYLAHHDAVELGPSRLGPGASEGLASAFVAARGDPTEANVQALFDAWRQEIAPGEADVEGVIEEARKAEPGKTWKATNGRVEASTTCPGICGKVVDTQEHTLAMERKGEWKLVPGVCSSTMGWEYVDHDGKVKNGCMNCAPMMAGRAVRDLQRELPLEELVRKQPNEWMAAAAELLKDKYPVKDWVFGRTFVRAAVPQMAPTVPRISKRTAAELGLDEDAGYPDTAPKRRRVCPNTGCDDLVVKRIEGTHGCVCTTCDEVVKCLECGRAIDEIGEDMCDACMV
jgi:hypothetical protein